MLVLTLIKNGQAVIDLREFGMALATVTLLDIREKGGKVRLGFDVDARVPVHRKKVFDAIERNKPKVEAQ